VQLGAGSWLAPRVLGEVVRHVGDRDLEKRFGGAVVERAVFAAMTRFYNPDRDAGFRGVIAFELTRPVSGVASSWWTVSVSEDAVARPGRMADAALRARLPMADFLRIAGGVIDPVEPVLAGRAVVSGDLGVAARLAEMFGAPPVR
jgi:putative sterol carrier protein